MCSPGEHKSEIDLILAGLAEQADPTAKVGDLTELALLELGNKLEITCTDPLCFRDIAFDWAVKFRRNQISLVSAA